MEGHPSISPEAEAIRLRWHHLKVAVRTHFM